MSTRGKPTTALELINTEYNTTSQVLYSEGFRRFLRKITDALGPGTALRRKLRAHRESATEQARPPRRSEPRAFPDGMESVRQIGRIDGSDQVGSLVN